MTVHIDTVLALALSQVGDAYVWGSETTPTDTNPDAFDCSELVQWACERAGVAIPDGSWIQADWVRDHGLELSVADAIRTRGALLFRVSQRLGNHVAFSLGDGRTIEARGRAWGVNVFSANNRPWTSAGRIPGVDYGIARPAPRPQQRKRKPMLVVQVANETPVYITNGMHFSHTQNETVDLMVATGEALRNGNTPFPILREQLKKMERVGYSNEKTAPGANG